MDPNGTQKHEVNNWEERGDLEPGGNEDPSLKLAKPFGFNPDAAPFVPFAFGCAQPQNNIAHNEGKRNSCWYNRLHLYINIQLDLFFLPQLY